MANTLERLHTGSISFPKDPKKVLYDEVTFCMKRLRVSRLFKCRSCFETVASLSSYQMNFKVSPDLNSVKTLAVS